MFQQFPIPYTHTNNSHPPPYSAQPATQSQVIDQLRRENEMLKRQLQDMIKMHTPTPTPTPRVNIRMTANNPPQDNEDDAETTYRNKISKLKMKKSNRKSYDQSATAPCSPKASTINQEQFHYSNHEQVPKLPFSKMMVISKDKEGRFFRDKSYEDKLTTERKYNPSQQRKQMQVPLARNEVNKENHQVKFLRANGHQRVESAFPGSSFQKTKRNFGQLTPSPTMTNIFQQKRQTNLQYWRQRSQEKRQPERTPPNHHFPLNLYQQPVEARVPRGNIYIQKVEEPERSRHCQQKETHEDCSSQGDSRLSIEIDIRNAKAKRKLNYGIYLEEDGKY